jgi:hypothetical protein
MFHPRQYLELRGMKLAGDFMIYEGHLVLLQ